MNVLILLDFAGVSVFAATGALAASRKQLDIVGFMFLACATGVGGGTFRDLVLGRTPVFWVSEPAYLLVCAATAVLLYFTAHMMESRYRILLWLDAVGLAAFCAMGAAVGLNATGSSAIAIVTGMATATFGGILRDILAGEKSVLLRPEIYVSAAAAGAALYTIADTAGAPSGVSALLAMAFAFVIRGGALVFGWTLPSYRARAGRTESELLRDGIVSPPPSNSDN
ncbi:MAG: trimeric intracellular cation channel family protein [Tepidamorphaceae bacterium]|nr:trimeric intracellular cation channel family protein [Rhodobiaceae bacterium]MCC0048078.1 trimeric intracellular cation channel family protein [Rhodobiaceae bacterium]